MGSYTGLVTCKVTLDVVRNDNPGSLYRGCYKVLRSDGDSSEWVSPAADDPMWAIRMALGGHGASEKDLESFTEQWQANDWGPSEPLTPPHQVTPEGFGRPVDPRSGLPGEEDGDG